MLQMWLPKEDPTNHRPERRVMDYRSYLLRAPKRREDFARSSDSAGQRAIQMGQIRQTYL